MSLLDRILDRLNLRFRPDDDEFVQTMRDKRQEAEQELRKRGIDPEWDLSTIQDLLTGQPPRKDPRP